MPGNLIHQANWRALLLQLKILSIGEYSSSVDVAGCPCFSFYILSIYETLADAVFKVKLHLVHHWEKLKWLTVDFLLIIAPTQHSLLQTGRFTASYICIKCVIILVVVFIKWTSFLTSLLNLNLFVPSLQDTTGRCIFSWITGSLLVWSTVTLPLSLLQAHCWSTSSNLCTLPTPPAQQAQGTAQD